MLNKRNAIAAAIPAVVILLLSCLITGCREERQSSRPATAPASKSRIISLYDQLDIGMTRSQAEAILGEPRLNLPEPNDEEWSGYIDDVERERELGDYESPMSFAGIRVIYKDDRIIDKWYNPQWVKEEHIELYERRRDSEQSPAGDVPKAAPEE